MKPKSFKFAGMTISEAYSRLISILNKIYDEREANNIADLAMEHITGLKRIDRVINREAVLNPAHEKQLEKYVNELSDGKPVQYVLNEAWFAGLKLYVDNNVLVPRPETEELVEWAADSIGEKINSKPSIIDIGTGSGCIAIALKKKLPGISMYAMDKSEGAINVAKKNAELNSTEIQFNNSDFLDEFQWEELPLFHFMVSNPPYIPAAEKDSMHDNVVMHEPHLALFVDNSDPLIFYKMIARFGKKKLLEEGKIFVEIHENFGERTKEVFLQAGYKNVIVKNDLQGKQRMIMASF